VVSLCHWVVNVGALCDRASVLALTEFGSFPGLPGDAAARVIYLIVLGFTAVGTASMLFFCEQTNAGRHFADPQGSANGIHPLMAYIMAYIRRVVPLLGRCGGPDWMQYGPPIGALPDRSW
jgi:hypothetical protein